MSSLGQFRKEFWTHYVNRFPDEQQREPAGGRSWRSRKFQSPDLAVVTYLAHQEVGVFIRRPASYTDQEFWDALNPFVAGFSNLTDGKFQEQSKGYLFISTYSGDTHNPENWDILADWLHSTADSYEAALKDIFAGQD